MNSAYNFNLYIGSTFSGSHECPLYTGLTVYFVQHSPVGQHVFNTTFIKISILYCSCQFCL